MFFTREDILKIQNALLKLSVKDSELPSAEPVTYDDTLSIVQDGKNKQIKIEDFFNQISLWKREDFINITDKYDEHYISLIEAIKLVPILQRKDGLVITFQDIEGNWEIYQFRGNITEFFNVEKWFNLYDYRNNIIQSIVPDEEDLTASTLDENGNSLVSLKDRIYDSTNFSGKGYKILRKNIQSVNIASTKITITKAPSTDGTLSFTINGKETQVAVSATTDNTTALVAQKIASAFQESITEYEVSIDTSLITLTRKSSGSVTPSIFSASTTGVVCTVTDSIKREFRNILMPNMINKSNTIYEIRYDFNLDGEEITIPEGCVLKFNGGILRNGNIYLNNTKLISDSIALKDIVIKSLDVNRNTFDVSIIESSDFGKVLTSLFENNIINVTFSKDIIIKTPILCYRSNISIISNHDIICISETDAMIIDGDNINIKIRDILHNRKTNDYINWKGSGIKYTGNCYSGTLNVRYIMGFKYGIYFYPRPRNYDNAGIQYWNIEFITIKCSSCIVLDIDTENPHVWITQSTIQGGQLIGEKGIEQIGKGANAHTYQIQGLSFYNCGFEGLTHCIYGANRWNYCFFYSCRMAESIKDTYIVMENCKSIYFQLVGIIRTEKVSLIKCTEINFVNNNNFLIGTIKNYSVEIGSINIKNMMSDGISIIIKDLLFKSVFIITLRVENGLVNKSSLLTKFMDDWLHGNFLYKEEEGIVTLYFRPRNINNYNKYTVNIESSSSCLCSIGKQILEIPSDAIVIKEGNPIIGRIEEAPDTKSGYVYFVTDKRKNGVLATLVNDKWVDADGIDININKQGSTSERPNLKITNEGFEFYDTTLKKKILWNGTTWVNIDGTVLS